MTDKHVLVAGATGRLGVVVDVLLDRGHSVRAMTRNPTSSAAARLRAAGAEVVYGDFEDAGSIAAAAAEADAIFAAGTAHRAGPEGELRHGRNIAGAAAAAGVPHLVYSSGEGAALDSPVPLFRVKYQVEQYIQSLPVAHTILAPVYFMENLFNPWNLPMLRAGAFPSPIAVELPLQQVAIADLAQMAALAIERPDEFAGRRIAVGSDELSAEQAAQVLARVIGRDFTAVRLSSEDLAPGLRALFAWLHHNRQTVDLAALHDRHPEVAWRDYEVWVRSQQHRLGEICPREHAGAR
ncbi:MAG TPA: NmrA family NAD(P)-binding protein [Solirubrobacteraceae bacterium]|nr:NmrA family NAD(P)-binding protein [Solirubrobacteraceae bacterium]